MKFKLSSNFTIMAKSVLHFKVIMYLNFVLFCFNKEQHVQVIPKDKGQMLEMNL